MRMLLSISEEMDEALEAERRQRKLRYKQEAIREILGTDPLALSEDKRVTTLDKAGINKDPYGCVKSALSVEWKQRRQKLKTNDKLYTQREKNVSKQ